MPRSARTHRAPAVRLLTLWLATAACGGGGDAAPTQPPPPPPPPPPTQATAVTLDRTTLTLVPREATNLVATPRDAAGAPLTGRSVAWSASDTSIVTVTAAGRVSARASGTATVTATVDGRTASAQVSVRDGGLVGASGGTVLAAGGRVRLVVPAGALSQDVPITVTPIASPPLATVVVPGTAYELGPSGTTFATPATIELAYTAPVGIDSAQAWHRVSRFTNGTWEPLNDNSGAQPGGTVLARLSGFSQFAITNDVRSDTLIVTPGSTAVVVGATQQLTVANPRPTFVPASARRDRSWNAPAIVTVSTDGLLTGVAAGGPVTITLDQRWRFACPLPSGRCFVGTRNAGTPQAEAVFADSLVHREVGRLSVVVTAVPVARLDLSETSVALDVGATRVVSATVRAANGAVLTGRAVTWRSSASAIASVVDGRIAAVSAGNAIITATSEGVEATVAVQVTLPRVAPHVAGGDGHSCAVVSTGAAYCWGENSSGELGFDNGGDLQLTARAVTGARRFTRIGAGNGGSCALSTAGQIFCWGENGAGYLGDGSPPSPARATPGPIASTLRFRDVSVSRAHRCAVTESDAVYCWGFNGAGQLGDGTTATAFTPVLVSGLPAVSAVAAGESMTCALARDQSLWCWGRNNFGQLGDGTTINRTSPVRLPGTRRYTAVTTGIRMSCALDDVGAAWCWGRGPVGDSSSTDRIVPTAVRTSQRFTHITSGSGHTCALALNGRAWCWGGLGAIGDGDNASREAPVAVAGDRAYTAIAAGYDVTCAVAADGVYCWGTNTRGEVGNNSRTAQRSPVRVLDLPTPP